MTILTPDAVSIGDYLIRRDELRPSWSSSRAARVVGKRGDCIMTRQGCISPVQLTRFRMATPVEIQCVLGVSDAKD
jgi:hypothetical protein